MAFQSVPETAEASVIYTVAGRTLQNTYHARFSGGYDTAALQALAAGVDASIGSGFIPLWTNDVVYLRTEVRGLEFENDQVVVDASSTAVGGVASDPLPNNVAFVVKRLSGLTGRSARGRVYIGGIPKSTLELVTSDNLTATAAVAWQAAVEAMRQDIDLVPGWSPVIVSRFENGVKRTPTAITFPWITTDRTDNRVDTRRDRLG